ncbi:aspartate ammonia-lyase [Desulfurobacterium atlanticum]|uniref:Aspartate ammonia-lyase n=1 Tax=Desulfurobacterium atlanticum TaxID=240169 RepID=A0A238ZUM6_9BACT|nr:aspartate ammonia-lyase [Desulfurobacterium atlanticum]SNR87117.1 aspartate ammonia-lyase [Desulfurobacterium atlanticum]
MDFRIEKDFLGEVKIPAERYYGIHTARSAGNFRLSGYKVPFELIKGFAIVKKAAAITNGRLGYIDELLVSAIVKACDEIVSGKFQEDFIVDALQGGAGTSTNMNVNEVIANRANEILGYEKGKYYPVHPLEHVNLHQSTNDTYPTALKIAVLFLLQSLSENIAQFQGVLQRKEKEFASILKIGRTELQEAVPITLGREFSAFADAVSRDRWRVWKAMERIRFLNIGGTAIGTGLAAPKDYIFEVVEVLRELTGLNISRHENPVSVTAFADDFVEVAGILDAYVSNLFKIANDLRLMNFLKEVKLKPVQPGSSIMPGKVNPVIMEATIQVAMKVRSNFTTVRECASYGTFQIVEFMPLLAFSMIESLKLLINATSMISSHLEDIKAVPERCEEYFSKSFSLVTALLPLIGYEKATEIVKEIGERGISDIKGFLKENLGEKVVEKFLSPEYLNSLGYDEDELEEFFNDNNPEGS